MLQFFFKYKNSFLVSLVTAVVALSMLGFGVQFFGEGGTAKGYAIKIDDEEIMPEELYRVRLAIEERYRQMLGPSFNQLLDTLAPTINQNAQDTVIEGGLLDRLVDQLGLRVDDGRVAKEIATNLFPSGYSAAAFANYLRQQGRTAAQFQEQLREEMARSDLMGIVQDLSEPTEDEVRRAARIAKLERTVQYATLDMAKFQDGVPAPTDEQINKLYEDMTVELTEPAKISYSFFPLSAEKFPGLVSIEQEEIELYYAEHQADYTLPARVKVRHLLLKVDTPDGKEKAQELANTLLARLKDGANFAQIVAENSSDGVTKDKGGELGWIDRGSANSELADKILSLPVAETSTPFTVTTKAGVHVVQVDERKDESIRPLPEVEGEIRAKLSGEALPSFLAAKGEELLSAWQKGGEKLDEFLIKQGLGSAQKSDGPLSEKVDPTVGGWRGLTAQVLARSDEGRFQVDIRDTPILVEVNERVEERLPPLEQVMGKVTEEHKIREARILGRNKLQEVLGRIRAAPGDFSKELTQIGAVVEAATKDFVGKIKDRKLQQRLNVVDVAPQVVDYIGDDAVKDRLVVAMVSEVKEPSGDELAKAIDGKRRELRQNYAEAFRQSVVSDLKARVNIEVGAGL